MRQPNSITRNPTHTTGARVFHRARWCAAPRSSCGDDRARHCGRESCPPLTTWRPGSKATSLTLLTNPTQTPLGSCVLLWPSSPLLSVTLLRRSGLLTTPGCRGRLSVRTLAPPVKPLVGGMRARSPTLRRLEHGDPAVSLGTVLAVARALGALDRLVDAVDPFLTDLGRARAGAALPKRVRHPRER